MLTTHIRKVAQIIEVIYTGNTQAPPGSLSVASTLECLGSSGRYAAHWSFATLREYEYQKALLL